MKDIRDISTLKNWDKNPRSIKEKDFIRLKNQITKLGQFKPLLITEDGTVLGGNMRLRAYQELGLKDIWVSVVDAPTEEKKLEYALSDNDRAGFYDSDLLANLIPNYPDFNWSQYAVDLKEPQSLQDLIDSLTPIEEDEVPEIPTEAVSKLGEVYQLGKHRLMCGDATKIEDVKKLMDGDKADVLLTDPPYGIRIVNSSNVVITAQVGFGKVGTKGLVPARKYSKIIGDEEPFDPTFLMELSDKIILWGANNYASKLKDNAHWLVWDKKAERGADHNNFSDCELAWTNIGAKSVRVYRYLWSGLLREGNRDIELKERVHPTQKPVGLNIEIIKDYSEENNVIVDLFGGSGSTLIACEQTNRICHMMEIDPKYCDVIRKRYAKFINKEEQWIQTTPIIDKLNKKE